VNVAAVGEDEGGSNLPQDVFQRALEEFNESGGVLGDSNIEEVM
jgi:hypothetical protein